jgi:hypothetical protein
MSSPVRQSSRVVSLSILFVLCILNIKHAQADLYFNTIWGRSGTVGVWGTESDQWVLATTDTDENTKYTQTSGPLGVNGALVSPNPIDIVFEGFSGFYTPVDVTTLGGSVITRGPHSLDSGTWAYGMAILDWPGPLELRLPIVESYFQIRLAGSSAVVQDTTLAQQAVLSGRWPSVDTYIEFNPNFAFYDANDSDPIRPSDYTGDVLPECSSAALLLFGLSAGLLRRLGYR